MSDQQVTTQVITELCGKVKLLQEKCMTTDDSEGQPDSNNLQAFKVITLFQHSAVPIFFEVALGHFTQSKGQQGVELLAQCLELVALRLKTAKNQMQYKMMPSDNTKILQFCTLQNTIEIVKNSPGNPPVDLVRSMLSLI